MIKGLQVIQCNNSNNPSPVADGNVSLASGLACQPLESIDTCCERAITICTRYGHVLVLSIKSKAGLALTI